MGDFPTQQEVYEGQVRAVERLVNALCLPAFKPGAENREDRIETCRQLMTGELRPAELEIDGDRGARRLYWSGDQVCGDGEAVEALKQAKAWYRARNEPPMPEDLWTWQPSPKGRGAPKVNGWRDANLALIVRKIVKATKQRPEFRLPISRNFATEKHLKLCDAVAEGWNRVFTAAA